MVLSMTLGMHEHCALSLRALLQLGCAAAQCAPPAAVPSGRWNPSRCLPVHAVVTEARKGSGHQAHQLHCRLAGSPHQVRRQPPI